MEPGTGARPVLVNLRESLLFPSGLSLLLKVSLWGDGSWRWNLRLRLATLESMSCNLIGTMRNYLACSRACAQVAQQQPLIHVMSRFLNRLLITHTV